EARLFPQCFTGRRRHTADDHIADFTLGVTGHDVDRAAGPHAITWTGWPRTSHFGVMPSPGVSGAVMNPFSRCGAPSAMETVTYELKSVAVKQNFSGVDRAR